MGLLDKILHKGDASDDDAGTVAAQCPHTALVPRWDSVDDMGHEDRATGYRCEACGNSFTPVEAQQLRAEEAERLRLSAENPSPS